MAARWPKAVGGGVPRPAWGRRDGRRAAGSRGRADRTSFVPARAGAGVRAGRHAPAAGRRGGAGKNRAGRLDPRRSLAKDRFVPRARAVPGRIVRAMAAGTGRSLRAPGHGGGPAGAAGPVPRGKPRGRAVGARAAGNRVRRFRETAGSAAGPGTRQVGSPGGRRGAPVRGRRRAVGCRQLDRLPVPSRRPADRHAASGRPVRVPGALPRGPAGRRGPDRDVPADSWGGSAGSRPAREGAVDSALGHRTAAPRGAPPVRQPRMEGRCHAGRRRAIGDDRPCQARGIGPRAPARFPRTPPPLSRNVGGNGNKPTSPPAGRPGAGQRGRRARAGVGGARPVEPRSRARNPPCAGGVGARGAACRFEVPCAAAPSSPRSRAGDRVHGVPGCPVVPGRQAAARLGRRRDPRRRRSPGASRRRARLHTRAGGAAAGDRRCGARPEPPGSMPPGRQSRPALDPGPSRTAHRAGRSDRPGEGRPRGAPGRAWNERGGGAGPADGEDTVRQAGARGRGGSAGDTGRNRGGRLGVRGGTPGARRGGRREGRLARWGRDGAGRWFAGLLAGRLLAGSVRREDAPGEGSAVPAGARRARTKRCSPDSIPRHRGGRC